MQKFGLGVNGRIEEITKIRLPMNPRVMLLLDFEYGGVVTFKILLAHMLTAATLLIAKPWKSEKELQLMDWIEKIRYMCLVNKLTAIIIYRTGNATALRDFKVEWKCFTKSRFSKVNDNVRVTVYIKERIIKEVAFNMYLLCCLDKTHRNDIEMLLNRK